MECWKHDPQLRTDNCPWCEIDRLRARVAELEQPTVSMVLAYEAGAEEHKARAERLATHLRGIADEPCLDADDIYKDGTTCVDNVEMDLWCGPCRAKAALREEGE